jgi:intraflagellar transport protein 46
LKGAQGVDNQPYDLAVDVNDSEEIESDEEEADEGNEPQSMKPAGQNKQQQSQHQLPAQKQQQAHQQKAQTEEEDDEDDKPVDGAYNPLQYANLPVSNEVKELFEYITRFKPQKIDLDSKMKPFIPEFVPAVGEVDSMLKMPRPDGSNEELGISVLDEPCLNNEDKTVLELKYVQSKNVVRSAPIDVDSIEQADKKPKEIGRWIDAV